MKKELLVTMLALSILLTSLSVAVPVSAEGGLRLTQGEKFAVLIDLNMYPLRNQSLGLRSIGLPSIYNNSIFDGVDYSSVVSSIASGPVWLGLYTDVLPEQPWIKLTPQQYMSSASTCYIILAYRGLTATGNFTVVITIGTITPQMNSTVVGLKLQIGLNQIIVISTTYDVPYLTIFTTLALGIFAIVVVFRIRRKMGPRIS